MKLLIPPPVYALLIGFCMWLLNQFFPWLTLVQSPWNKLGILIIVVTGLSDLSSLYLFVRKHTTANPMHPENTQELVTGGLYRITRNPMYLGLLIILMGYGIWLGSVMPFLLLPLFYWLITEMQIKPEEVILEEKFGQEYLDFKNRVRRWL